MEFQQLKVESQCSSRHVKLTTKAFLVDQVEIEPHQVAPLLFVILTDRTVFQQSILILLKSFDPHTYDEPNFFKFVLVFFVLVKLWRY